MLQNTFADIEYILTTCANNGSRFEIECYDIGHLYTLRHFADRGVVKPPFFIQSVFGILGGIGHTRGRHAHEAHRRSPVRRGVSLERAGRRAQPDGDRRPGRGMGGNVRVGMEDSLWIGPGKLTESNAQQVTNVRTIIEGLGLEIASSDEAREILKLKGGDRVAF